MEVGIAHRNVTSEKKEEKEEKGYPSILQVLSIFQ